MQGRTTAGRRRPSRLKVPLEGRNAPATQSDICPTTPKAQWPASRFQHPARPYAYTGADRQAGGTAEQAGCPGNSGSAGRRRGSTTPSQKRAPTKQPTH